MTITEDPTLVENLTPTPQAEAV
ncbi:MAG: hypothetical protein V7636_292, partial [Actinomycetota bacterium]